MASAIHALGEEDFSIRLSDAAGQSVRWQMRTVMRYSRTGPPQLLSTEGLDAHNLSRYEGGYYRFDPIYRRCLQAPRQGLVSVKDTLEEHRDARPYRSFFRDSSISDELAVLLPLLGGTTVVLSFARSSSESCAAELERLEHFNPVAAALHEAHLTRVLGAPAIAPGRTVLGEAWALFDACRPRWLRQ